MLRKNFYETHLAQFEKLFSGAIHLQQEKMRKHGLTSKIDLLSFGHRSQCEISREKPRPFPAEILQNVTANVDRTSSGIPRSTCRESAEFDLEKCPDIEMCDLCKPPHFEKYSLAQEVLSAARNSYNCSTPMQRALDRLKSKKLEEKEKQQQNQEQRGNLNEIQGNINLKRPRSP
jgi:chromatin licensing and DNA replication factor 1